MIIDTEVDVGQQVCDLDGSNVFHSPITKISFEWSYTKDTLFIVYELSDGTISIKNETSYSGPRLFKDKASLIKHLEEQ